MHSSRILQSAASILALLAQCRLSEATPLEFKETDENGLEKRCDNLCGYYQQLCCASSEVCSTNSAGEAVCVASTTSSGSGSWEYYTTTYVVTETGATTVTSVWSTWVATTTGSCRADLGETTCGSDCCGAAYVCTNNQCVLGSTSVWATETETATAPVRGTSTSTVTQTVSPTVTQGFDAPVTTDGVAAYGVDAPDHGGLSGGAIAGIVIGTIAGVFLLLLVCACFCCRGIIDSLLACLGIGKRRRTDTTYVEEHYSQHAHGARPEGRTWFGARPSGPDQGGEKKSRWSNLATIGIIIGALALCLGLRRKRDQDEKSDYTYPSYYSYYTSTTSDSSDRRTRQSRRSRRSGSRTHS
ncbi:hypothetical protein P175DRAFT_0465253 [Aspergillus ochraceoroseus IBT 24754]|uniref:Mid2 domain-containing protein n=1 Tax=Aspergillus ochraceoroseus IBT 24754 TaxID=1392256 RepID=A0A2T5LPY0_9EURO|nr:uncharacterized protein P175DRAFT_0465253 [Aspergillus ochraceoroseus IBT 24754]PTU18342.1 hypothetical protein P175DRAFT_0465253 [Aspergillus ochraceoroseus IBT 24754]